MPWHDLQTHRLPGCDLHIMGSFHAIFITDQFNVARLIWNLPLCLLVQIDLLAAVGLTVHDQFRLITVSVRHHTDHFTLSAPVIPVRQHMTHGFSGKDRLRHVKRILRIATGIHHAKIGRYGRPCIRCRLSQVIKTGPHKCPRHKITRHDILPGLTHGTSPVCTPLIIAADQVAFIILLITAAHGKSRCRFTCKHRHVRVLLMKRVILICLVIDATHIQRIHGAFLRVQPAMHRTGHKTGIIQRTDLIPHGLCHSPAFLCSLQRLLVKDRIHDH